MTRFVRTQPLVNIVSGSRFLPNVEVDTVDRGNVDCIIIITQLCFVSHNFVANESTNFCYPFPERYTLDLALGYAKARRQQTGVFWVGPEEEICCHEELETFVICLVSV